jgi:pimeloyl-ACP methyl ester carboxylesterase
MAAANLKTHCLGEGPSVVLIGGGPAFTTWNLQPIQQRLSSRHRVCRWDMRGVGDNADLPIAADRTVLSQWIQDMHDVLPDEPVTLWGHSWGALQVLLFSRQYPHRVRQLILSNPVDPALHALQGIEQKRFSHNSLNHQLRLEDIGTPVEEMHHLHSKIASYFTDAEQGWAYAQGFTRADANNRLNVRVWQDYRRAPLVDADMQQLANKISGIIFCQQDILQPEALAEYRRLLGPDKHHVLSGCAHFPWEENAQAYYRVLSLLID